MNPTHHTFSHHSICTTSTTHFCHQQSLPDKPAKLFYSKLPPGVESLHILLCDPMLATGGSALKALEVLCDQHGVDSSKVVFATMVCAPEGIKAVQLAYPDVKIVTAMIDECLNEEKYIVPGLGM